MSRTDQEFKAEVLRRSEEYCRRRWERRKKLINTTLCLVLVIVGFRLVSPFFAMGGSAEPMKNAVMDGKEAMGQMAEPEYSVTEIPAAADAHSVTGDSYAADAPIELVPMVMIDGVLYLDTGAENDDLRKCGTYDGKITSVVSVSEIPTEDDQSNFGIGYGYQYGGAEWTVEVYMEGKWRIFAAEQIWEEFQITE